MHRAVLTEIPGKPREITWTRDERLLRPVMAWMGWRQNSGKEEAAIPPANSITAGHGNQRTPRPVDIPHLQKEPFFRGKPGRTHKDAPILRRFDPVCRLCRRQKKSRINY